MRKAAYLLALACLAGLGAAPAPAGTNGGTYVYVHDRGATDQVFAFEMDREGMLTPLAGSPFAGPGLGNGDCSGYCETLSYSKKRKLLFSGHTLGMTVWTVAKDGTLALVEGSPFGSATNWGAAVVQRGPRTFVYSGLEDTGEMAGYEVQEDGTLVELDDSPFPAADGTLGTRAYKNVLVAYNENACSVSSWSVGADGVLTAAPNSPVATPATCSWHVDLDLRGKFAYVGNDEGTIPTYAVDRRTGELTAIEGSPQDSGLLETRGGVGFSKKLAITGGYNDVGLQVFRVGRGGLLTTLGEPQDIDPPSGLRGHQFTTNGKVLVLAYEGEVRTYSVDGATGALTPIDTETIASARVNDVVVLKR
jgi:6-phosphogluconolactonase (cycloisomerase 2 family)